MKKETAMVSGHPDFSDFRASWREEGWTHYTVYQEFTVE